ncbi:MAG TPA: endolytic transglycosylase MltG [Nevskiales bacterium]|nr:endolytic transglycosylase MltG [Nevskiales bacterium]
MAARRVIRRALWVYGSLLAVFAGIVAGAVAWDLLRFLNSPLPVTEPRLLRVEPGSNFHSLGRQWVNEGLIRWPHHARYLRLYARLSGKATRLKAGEYQIRPGVSPRQLVDDLVSGRAYQYSLTIIEGWTFQQMMQAVAAAPTLRPTLPDHSAEAVMRALGRPGEHPEGRFFPDTYHFPGGTTDVDFLRRAYDTMARVLEQEWQGRAPDLPLNSPYEALILASIIEKETGQPQERAEIAGVFVRRLRLGMLLQTDPTVIYGMGSAYDGNIRLTDLKRDTPYNTYTRAGLTPTPICLPGREAIHAALHPAPGDSLYFVARGDGSHHFSSSLEEHNEAVRKFQLKQP